MTTVETRAAGILLHLTSLPGPVEEALGAPAHAFLDWMERAALRYWQVLPIGPPDPSHSPYSALSDRAGNPRWVPRDSAGERTEQRAEDEAAWAAWKAAPEQRWLDDWVLFAALKERFEGAPWWHWNEGLKRRDASALAAARQELAERVEAHGRIQFRFHQAWTRLHRAARDRGVRLLGDLPMYPARDSAEVWARPDLFELDGDLHPVAVAGVPPDYFSADGQRWGNPLYRWERHREEGFAWWIERIRHQLRRFDGLRLDHFRGFASYWRVPAEAPTAAGGTWVPGPGLAFFETLRDSLATERKLPLILEDLGEVTPDLVTLRDRLTGPDWGLPTLRVLQFGFAEDNEHTPHRLTPTTVVYTGTHDNDTSAGWYHQLPEDTQRRVRLYTGCGERDPASMARALVRLAYTSVANLAILPMQDVLGLGSEARMNTPGTATGNWSWQLTAPPPASLAEALRRLAAVSGREGGGR
jgi:4-alpha-glucanotransferase